MQRHLRRNHTDSLSGFNSFQYGKSVSNQRIEAWWSFFKRDTLSSWINYFRDMRDQNLYDDSNLVHVDALRFAFIGVLQAELDKTALYWNHHRIRRNRNSEVPDGNPDILYSLPGVYRGKDCGFSPDSNELQMATSLFTEAPPTFACSEEFAELAAILMKENQLQYPFGWKDAETLYLNLINLANSI